MDTVIKTYKIIKHDVFDSNLKTSDELSALFILLTVFYCDFILFDDTSYHDQFFMKSVVLSAMVKLQ